LADIHVWVPPERSGFHGIAFSGQKQLECHAYGNPERAANQASFCIVGDSTVGIAAIGSVIYDGPSP
jgi:hypothetical protein